MDASPGLVTILNVYSNDCLWSLCTSFDASFSRFIQTAVVHLWQGVAMSIEWRHVITDITVHLQRGGAIGTFSIGWRHVIAGRSFNGPAFWNFNANVFSHFSSAWRGKGGVCPFPPVWEDNVIPHFLSLPRFSLLRNYKHYFLSKCHWFKVAWILYFCVCRDNLPKRVWWKTDTNRLKGQT